jgi:hypothetical protein
MTLPFPIQCDAVSLHDVRTGPFALLHQDSKAVRQVVLVRSQPRNPIAGRLGSPIQASDWPRSVSDAHSTQSPKDAGLPMSRPPNPRLG